MNEGSWLVASALFLVAIVLGATIIGWLWPMYVAYREDRKAVNEYRESINYQHNRNKHLRGVDRE